MIIAFAVAAALLAFSGVAKLRDPEPLRRALRELGLPSRLVAVYAFGGVESVVGVTALISVNAVTAGLLALAYASFAAVLAYALLRGVSLSSCGCVGRRETPPTWTHVGLNLIAAATGAWAAMSSSESFVSALLNTGALGAPLLLACVFIVYQCFLMVAYFDLTFFAYRNRAQGVRRSPHPDRRGHAR